MVTESGISQHLEGLESYGITPITNNINGTTFGLESSLPDLYRFVSLPEEPRKFLSFPASYQERGNANDVFVKTLYVPREDFKTQLLREFLAAKEIQNATIGSTNSPVIKKLINDDDNLILLYELLDPGYKTLSVPFLPASIETSGLEMLKLVVHRIEEWQSMGSKDYKPSDKFLEFSGYDLQSGKYIAPTSIKGLSGMPTPHYETQFLEIFENGCSYLITQQEDGQYRLSERSLVLPKRSLDVIKTSLRILSPNDFNFKNGYSFVHSDLGPQNIMKNDSGKVIIVDLENITLAANGLLGKTADLAHLTSRLWYNEPWQDALLRYVDNKDAKYRIAYHVNLALETLRRLTRPITYYANGEIDGEKTFAPEMAAFSSIRNRSNLSLFLHSIKTLERTYSQ